MEAGLKDNGAGAASLTPRSYVALHAPVDVVAIDARDRAKRLLCLVQWVNLVRTEMKSLSLAREAYPELDAALRYRECTTSADGEFGEEESTALNDVLLQVHEDLERATQLVSGAGCHDTQP